MSVQWQEHHLTAGVLRPRIVQKVLVVLMDATTDEPTEDRRNSLVQLRSVVNDVNLFTQRDQAIDFLTDIHELNAFLVIEGSTAEDTLPLIYDIPELDAVYPFSLNQSHHEQWTKKWVKIKSAHTDIKSFCEALQVATKQCDHDQNSIKTLTDYCRAFYKDNTSELRIIQEFERDYRSKIVIWWYTRECFIYQILNRVLRTLEEDTIINMGFLIRDLHQQIQELHHQQVSNYYGKIYTVYQP